MLEIYELIVMNNFATSRCKLLIAGQKIIHEKKFTILKYAEHIYLLFQILPLNVKLAFFYTPSLYHFKLNVLNMSIFY